MREEKKEANTPRRRMKETNSFITLLFIDVLKILTMMGTEV